MTKARSIRTREAIGGRRRNPEDPSFRSDYNIFAANYRDTVDVLTRALGLDLDDIARLEKPVLPTPIYAFYTYVDGRRLVARILKTKAVPGNKVKKLEKASRAFAYKKRPADISAWFVKNHPSLKLLLESDQWPNISDQGDLPSSYGIEIISQTAEDAGPSISLVEDAVTAIMTSGIDNAARTIYGKVYIVGDIAKKKSIAAFYNYTDDDIYVLRVKRTESERLRYLIHEFGHRYWRKFASQTDKGAWERFHRLLKRKSSDLRIPEEGDAILDSTVSYVAGNAIFLKGGGYVKLDNYLDWLRQQQMQDRFPTMYATTNAEEHFCECFSFYCLGSLTGPSLDEFKRLFVLG